MKRLAILFSLFIVAVIVAADLGVIDPYLKWLSFYGGDKIGHFALYGLLNFILILALCARTDARPKRVAWTVSLVLAALVGLEEWSQSFIPARTMSLDDLLASYAGMALAAYVAYQAKMRETRSKRV